MSHERYDAADHLMTYLFRDPAGLVQFGELATALSQAGRMPYLLPAVERAVYRLRGIGAAPRIKAGADVLPWWPARGVYVLIERGEESPSALVDVPGVGGVWWARSVADSSYATTQEGGLQITYCFLDEDPPQAAQRLRPVLEKRWAAGGSEPLLAAPFHLLVPHEWASKVP